MIFDTHCHAYWNSLANRHPELRANMHAEGVLRSVQIGTGWETSQAALSLSREWSADTWCTAGIHPTGCQDLPQDTARKLMELFAGLVKANPDKVVGIGETGLDYYHLTRGKESNQKQTQLVFFRAQAELAQELDLPLIIHTRDAAEDTVALIKALGIKRAVIHCFSENLAFAQELLEWSGEIYFSFSGILTYRKSQGVQDAASALKLDRILVETDAPFLVPQPMRDQSSVNEPAFTRHVLECLKMLRSEPGDAVEQAVWDNSNRFYRI
jgi:TatD DNase family protein